MSRSDLVGTNAAIVGDVAARVARTSPDAVIGLGWVGVDDGRALSLASLRGDLVVVVVADLDRAGVKDLVVRMTAGVHDATSGLRLTWGVSRPHDDVVALPSALNEARTALSAAHRLGGRTCSSTRSSASCGCCSAPATTRTCSPSSRR